MDEHPTLLFSCDPSTLKHNSGTRLSPVPAEKNNKNREKKKEKEFYALKKKNKKVMCDVLPRVERGQRLRQTFPGERECCVRLSQQERSLGPKAAVAKEGIS